MKKKALSGTQKDQQPLGDHAGKEDELRGQALVATQNSYVLV
jgi:hypothetical protein